MKYVVAILALVLVAGCDIPESFKPSQAPESGNKTSTTPNPPPQPAGPSAAEIRAITEATVAVAKLEAEMKSIRSKVQELNDAEARSEALPKWRKGRNALSGLYSERGELYLRYQKIERDELPAAKARLEQLTKAE